MAAAYAIESLGLSERRACLLTCVSPSVYRYQAKQGDDALRLRMRELAEERKRFGSPRLHIMLKREGLVVNHKRTERIYSEEELALRKKRRRKGAARTRGRPFHFRCALTRGGPWTLSRVALWSVGASVRWP